MLNHNNIVVKTIQIVTHKISHESLNASCVKAHLNFRLYFIKYISFLIKSELVKH